MVKENLSIAPGEGIIATVRVVSVSVVVVTVAVVDFVPVVVVGIV